MNITQAQYYAEEGVNYSINATIDGQIISVPLDPDNTDYQAIQEWAKIDGNTIEEAD